MKTIKFILWDQDTDGIAVEVDGREVWQDSGSEFDQYLRHYMPRGVPVLLDADTRPSEHEDRPPEREGDDRPYPQGESTDIRLARWLVDNTPNPLIRLDVEEGSPEDVPVTMTAAELGFLLYSVAERMYFYGADDVRERHGIR